MISMKPFHLTFYPRIKPHPFLSDTHTAHAACVWCAALHILEVRFLSLWKQEESIRLEEQIRKNLETKTQMPGILVQHSRGGIITKYRKEELSIMVWGTIGFLRKKRN